MYGPLLGILLAFTIPGGWGTLLVACAIGAIALAWYRIGGAYWRLKRRAGAYSRIMQDCMNLSLGTGRLRKRTGLEYEERAIRIMETRDLPANWLRIGWYSARMEAMNITALACLFRALQLWLGWGLIWPG